MRALVARAWSRVGPDVPPAPARATVSSREPGKNPGRILGWALIAALLAGWELAVAFHIISTPDLPRLSAVGAAWIEYVSHGPGLLDTRITLTRALLGFGAAAIAGGFIGLAMGASKTLDALLEPLVELLRPVPSTALVPLAILLFGIGAELKIAIAFVAAFFPILVNSYAGARNVAATLIETALTFRLTARERLFHIILPAALPSVFVGLKLGLTVALIVTIVTEMLAGNEGLGYRIFFSQQMLQMPLLYAGLFTIALAGYLLNFLFVQLERKTIFWSERIRRFSIS